MLDNEIKYHEFILKGRFPEHRKDRLTGWGFSDIGLACSWGKMIFKGTEQESNEFWDEVIGSDETYYKVIGVHEFPEDGYETKGKLIFTKNTQQICQQPRKTLVRDLKS